MHGVFLRVLALLGWRSYSLFIRSLEDAAAGVVAAVPVEIDELRADDIGDYLARGSRQVACARNEPSLSLTMTDQAKPLN